MSLIYPDAKVSIRENNRKLRIGLIVRDANNNHWGITAKHVFEGLLEATLEAPNGAKVGSYNQKDNDFKFAEDSILNQVVRFRISKEDLIPENVRYDIIWPRFAVHEDQLLNTKVISIESQSRTVGNIIETQSFTKIKFQPTDEEIVIGGAILMQLEDPTIVKPGMGGTLLLSNNAEALALGIARQKRQNRLQIIACPLFDYLHLMKMRPWAPLGAHWSDLEIRGNNFFEIAARDQGPDLGFPPNEFRRRYK